MEDPETVVRASLRMPQSLLRCGTLCDITATMTAGFSYCSHHCNQTADQKHLKEGRIYPGSEFRERIHHCEPGMVTEEAGYNTRTVRKQGGARCRPDITYGDCSPAPTVSTF